MVPANKIHDIHPAIRPTGLYWTTQLDASNFTFSADGRKATLDMNNLECIDEPKWPNKQGPASPATISYHLEWTANGAQYPFSSAAKNFSVLAYPAQVRASFKVTVPSADFSWTSDPMETSTSTDGLVGSEVNGTFYQQGMQPGQGTMPGVPNTGGGASQQPASGSPNFGLGAGAALLGLAGAALLGLRHRGLSHSDADDGKTD